MCAGLESGWADRAPLARAVGWRRLSLPLPRPRRKVQQPIVLAQKGYSKSVVGSGRCVVTAPHSYHKDGLNEVAGEQRGNPETWLSPTLSLCLHGLMPQALQTHVIWRRRQTGPPYRFYGITWRKNIFFLKIYFY